MPTPTMIPMMRLVVSHRLRRGGSGRGSRIVGSIGRTPFRVKLGHGEKMGHGSPRQRQFAPILARRNFPASPIAVRKKVASKAAFERMRMQALTECGGTFPTCRTTRHVGNVPPHSVTGPKKARPQKGRACEC